MGIYWLAQQYEQCLAPMKERVKTWDNDTEFGLALVDRQFDSMFDEAHVFFDRPPTDPYGKDPDKNWYGALYLRTARDLSLEVPLHHEVTRTVTMAAGTMIWFSIGMVRIENRRSGHTRRGRRKPDKWHAVKQARFEVGQAQSVHSIVEVFASPQTKWMFTQGDRILDENTWNIELGSWDCVQNYRSRAYYELGNGHELRSSQPRFKTLKALAVSMWGVVMSHAAHGDGFDGRIGIDAAAYYQRDWNITADDCWASLGDIQRNADGDFHCDICDEWCDDDNYYGTHGGSTWCWECVNEHRSTCEWCDAEVWDDDDEGLYFVKLLGSSWEVGICPSCMEELESCDNCGLYSDTRESPPLPELTYKVYRAWTQEWKETSGKLCRDCASEHDWYQCGSCEEWFNANVEGCDIDNGWCAECVKEQEEENTCDSVECASSVSEA